MRFAGPLSQINHFAAFAAEGAPFRVVIPNNFFAAGGAVYDGLAHSMQQVSLKGMSLSIWLGRSQKVV